MYLPVFIFIFQNSALPSDFQKLVYVPFTTVPAADLFFFFSHNIFALLFPAIVNWIFVNLIAPLTAAQAELIISCVCQVVILFISLLQFSSHIC